MENQAFCKYRPEHQRTTQPFLKHFVSERCQIISCFVYSKRSLDVFLYHLQVSAVLNDEYSAKNVEMIPDFFTSIGQLLQAGIGWEVDMDVITSLRRLQKRCIDLGALSISHWKHILTCFNRKSRMRGNGGLCDLDKRKELQVVVGGCAVAHDFVHAAQLGLLKNISHRQREAVLMRNSYEPHRLDRVPSNAKEAIVGSNGAGINAQQIRTQCLKSLLNCS